MAETALLVTVSGPDRPGIATAVFGALAEFEPSLAITDVGQVTIHGHLVLCVEVTIDSATAPEVLRRRILDRGVGDDNVSVTVTHVSGEDTLADRTKRLMVTLVAPAISSDALSEVFAAMARSGATCERIVHLASYPVDCYELVVRTMRRQELREELTRVALAAGLDVAVQRAGLHRRAKHLVVVDADSTLLQEEVIDLLAAKAGVAEQVSDITHRAMIGELGFGEALRERVALLKGLPESIFDEVRREVTLTPGAQTFLRTLKRLGYVTAVVSGGFEEILAPLVAELGVDHLAANSLVVRDGFLTGEVASAAVDREGKAAALERLAREVGVPLEQTVAIGDGANDIDMLALAGLGIAFNAKAVVREHADATLNVPYLDAALNFMGISRDEIDAG
jgi:phosphoserine phosphatase